MWFIHIKSVIENLPSKNFTALLHHIFFNFMTLCISSVGEKIDAIFIAWEIRTSNWTFASMLRKINIFLRMCHVILKCCKSIAVLQMCTCFINIETCVAQQSRVVCLPRNNQQPQPHTIQQEQWIELSILNRFFYHRIRCVSKTQTTDHTNHTIFNGSNPVPVR